MTINAFMNRVSIVGIVCVLSLGYKQGTIRLVSSVELRRRASVSFLYRGFEPNGLQMGKAR